MPHSIAELEAMAAMRGLNFAQELSFLSIILENDSKVIIKALRANEDSLISFSHLIAEAKLISFSFCSIIFNHVCRQGNIIAHNLVRHTRHVSSFSVWMEDAPLQINNVLLANVS